ncbi:RidA family protein [Paraburkholderia flava]|uniref:RidA family protein n=1 Tax=Paraburkholderia flava TaxID=2547393 RepID=UPI00105F05D4|nr:RidA family protein [Paraburkholderia flava]
MTSADIVNRLAQLGLTLPLTPSPRGAYVGAVIHDDIAYISGQVSRVGNEVIAGPVDRDTPHDVIRHAARTCVLRALSVLVATMPALPTSATVERILFLRGFVNAVPGFANHSQVMDEASALLHEIFGDSGRHARSAVGVASLPGGGLLEIELVVALTRAPQQRPDEHTAST